MAASFPTSLATIQRVSATDLRNAPGKEGDVLHNKLCDEVEALQAKVGIDGSAVSTSLDAKMTAAQADITALESQVQDNNTPAAVRDLVHGSVSYTPSGIGWDYTKYPISPSVTVASGKQRRGSAGITPEALFDLFSVARTAPTTTYYVDIATGSDSNNGLTSGTKFKSIYKAISAGNATLAPYKVYVTAGTYSRLDAMVGSPTIRPLYDACFIAVGGQVVCSPHETFSAPSLDGTYGNCYTISTSSVTHVLDLKRKQPNGSYAAFKNVATAALCNAIPGSWAEVSGTVYINRGDGVAVTESNTRLLRKYAPLYLVASTIVNIFIGAEDGMSSWAFFGSDGTAQLRVAVTSPTGSAGALVFSGVSSLHAGGVGAEAGNATNLDSYPGICAFFDCALIGPGRDGFSMRNTYAAASPVLLTVNCYGENAGSLQNSSCNHWTLHNGCVGIDIAGYYSGACGGAVHTIDASRSALIGTHVENDLGDVHYGGSIRETCVRTANTSEMECYAVTTWQPGGGTHYHALDSSEIRLFDQCTWPARYAGNVDASGN